MNALSYWFLIFALLAEIAGTIGGFGSSVFFVPLANFFFSFQVVLGITALFHVASNVSKIVLFRHGLDKKLLLYMGLPAVLFVILGGYLSKYISTTYLELILGIFLVGLSLLFLLVEELVIKASKFNAAWGGLLSGFSAGLLGTGGAIRGLTMAAFNLEKNAFIATSAFIDFLVDFSRSIVYWQNGYMKDVNLWYLPFLLAVGFVGTWIGKKILVYIPQQNFKRISLLLILVIGLLTLVRLYVER